MVYLDIEKIYPVKCHFVAISPLAKLFNRVKIIRKGKSARRSFSEGGWVRKAVGPHLHLQCASGVNSQVAEGFAMGFYGTQG